uniref:FAS1 domain-containing protein n=1 Tax=Leersia perrieri TaxID=77586 RepID=A0A0D9XBK1_9ORYZ
MVNTGDEDCPDQPEAAVADLLKDLHLTAEEEEIAAFSDDEDVGDCQVEEWSLVGKVLSPMTIHATAILGAMKAAWGNPAGLKIRSIGSKGDNLFVAEFSFKQDLERAVGGSPWVVGKHAVILREYEEHLKPSEIVFDKMEIWVRILDLPLGWMNQHRGERALGLIGEVKKVDVDRDGKASGPFLRGRVAIDVLKPLRRGVLLRTRKEGAADWFDIQYEKLPFYCLSYGVMGQSQIECDKPLVRNPDGRLPYDAKLRVNDFKKKKLQSFVEAAAETFGSGSSSASEQSRGSASKSGDRRTGMGSRSSKAKGKTIGDDDDEVNSPVKPGMKSQEKESASQLSNTNRQLFQPGDGVSSGDDGVRKHHVPQGRQDRLHLRDADDTVKPSRFVKSVKEIPYDISVLQVSSVLSSSEAEAPVPPPVPVNLTELLSKKYCKSFAGLLAANADVFRTVNETKDNGLTLFCPVDAVIAAFMPSYKNLTAKAKTVILLYHAVPDYFSLQLLKSNNGMVTTLATASEAKKDYSYDVQNKGETITLDTRVVNSAVTATVGDNEPLAVYAVNKFLKPKELYKVVEAPAPAPEPSKKHKAADDSGDDSADNSGDAKPHKGDAAPAALLAARWVAGVAAALAGLMLLP